MRSFLLASALMAWSSCAPGAVTFQVVFDDPGGQLTAFRAPLESHLIAAGNDWASRLQSNATITIRVRPNTAIPFSSGYSHTSAFVGTNAGLDMFEQGAAYHIRTGTSISPANPDIEFIINPSYLANNLWFDADPVARTAPVPLDRTDAMSVMLHELGHALAFNGWMDGVTGDLPGYKSTFDRWVEFDGEDFFFTGPLASNVYGGPVPVTFGNPFHLGNNAPRPGSDLIPTLMNGVVFFFGQRYFISDIDWAILADVGLPVTFPCVADVDDGTGTGSPDGGIGIEDLLFYLSLFEGGGSGADVDDGTGSGTPDGGVGIEDLLYYLARFESGC